MVQLSTYLYLLATVCFILGIKRLSKVKTARSGNGLSALGMLIAIIAVLIGSGVLTWWMVVAGLVIGGGIGQYMASKVEMTEMPELVAAFNGLGGASSAFVGLSILTAFNHTQVLSASASITEAITIPISIIIGMATLTGSFVAYLKLGGKKLRHPLSGSARHSLHAGMGLMLLVVSFWVMMYAEGATSLTIATVVLLLLAASIGALLVIPIGGADMPVVVALLNSYSGLAAAASGFVIGNMLLIVSGALVGASGMVLTMIMCKAMNRSLGNVLLGGIDDDAGSSEDARDYKNIKESSAEEIAMLFDAATSVIIVPGYGLAVAQAQHTVRELATELEKRDIQVRYAIHPVAGRMPGHMNVLLAEADVPYDQLFELEKINGDFQNTDVVVVIGANDVVNPIAREDSGSPIAGMPILDVDYAQTVVVIKRSLSPGYAGIKNPLFENDNTLMIFADAKVALQEMVAEVKDL